MLGLVDKTLEAVIVNVLKNFTKLILMGEQTGIVGKGVEIISGSQKDIQHKK